MQHHLIDGIGATPGMLEPVADHLAQGRPLPCVIPGVIIPTPSTALIVCAGGAG
jgi:hypothetical protein